MPRSLRSVSEQPSRRHRLISSRHFTLAPNHRRHSSKLRKSLAPSSDIVPHRVAPAKLSNPPRSAASLVIPRCRCRKRHPPTQSHATLTIAKQRQPAQSATSSQPVTMRQLVAAIMTSITSTWARQHPSNLPCGEIVDTC
jgi:hypothetical protein